MSSPTQRSLELLRQRGYLAAVVEKWIVQARIRQDLFGLFDIIAICDRETMAVQTTSATNIASRVKKIAESDKTPIIRRAGWKIVVHGWSKRKGRWTVREVDCT